MIEYLLLLLLLPPSLELFHQDSAKTCYSSRWMARSNLLITSLSNIWNNSICCSQSRSKNRPSSLLKIRGNDVWVSCAIVVSPIRKPRSKFVPLSLGEIEEGWQEVGQLDPYKPIADYTGACFGRRRGKKGPEASSYTSTAAINQCLPSVGKTMPCCLHNWRESIIRVVSPPLLDPLSRNFSPLRRM